MQPWQGWPPIGTALLGALGALAPAHRPPTGRPKEKRAEMMGTSNRNDVLPPPTMGLEAWQEARTAVVCTQKPQVHRR